MADTTRTAAQAHADTPAAKYLSALAKDWSDARHPLEDKWNRNRNHFRRVFSKVFKSKDGEGWRSRAVPGFLRQKVLTAYSLMIDMLMQNGNLPFSLKASRSLRRDTTIDPAVYASSVHRAEARIRDQLALCHADRSFQRNVLAAALYGRTWAKKTRGIFAENGYKPVPTPAPNDTTSINPDTLTYNEYESEHTGPAWEYVSNWEMFTDPEYEHPRDPNSGGTYQERLITPRWLRDKQHSPFYIPAGIQACIEQAKNAAAAAAGKASNVTPPYLRDLAAGRRIITYREWWVWVPRALVEATEAQLAAANQDNGYSLPHLSITAENDGDDVYVMCCTANDHIVRWVRVNPREMPFFMADWDKAVDETLPDGVADNAEFAQNLLAGGLRMFINNKRLTANAMYAINTAVFKNAPRELEPGTNLHLKGSAEDIGKGMHQIVTQDVGESLLSLIGLAEKYGDWDTLLPKISQGLTQGAGQQTAYEISQQLERADKYTASVARNFDEYLIEPIVSEFHRDNMEDPDIADGRGDYVVEALGFQAVQDRVFRISIYSKLLELAMLSPEIYKRAKIGRMLEHITRAYTVDPAEVWFTDEEVAAQPPPGPPAPSPEAQRVEQAQIAALDAKAQRDLADADARRLSAQTKAAQVELDAEQQEREAQAIIEPGAAAI